MAKGGARPGAGRPKGSKYLDLQQLLKKQGEIDDKDYIQEYIEYLIANYKESDKLMIWMGEHIFGKPVQPVEGELNGELTLTFDNAFTPKTKRSGK
jgi:hypothetical protein